MITARVVEVRLEITCDACRRSTRSLVQQLPVQEATSAAILRTAMGLEEEALSAAKRLKLLGETRKHICPSCENAISPVLA